jgi:hypothetical protein
VCSAPSHAIETPRKVAVLSQTRHVPNSLNPRKLRGWIGVHSGESMARSDFGWLSPLFSEPRSGFTGSLNRCVSARTNFGLARIGGQNRLAPVSSVHFPLRIQTMMGAGAVENRHPRDLIESRGGRWTNVSSESDDVSLAASLSVQRLAHRETTTSEARRPCRCPVATHIRILSAACP